MELSLQIPLFDAIQRGLKCPKFLDEKDHFLKLWYGSHVEYVKNGNMTPPDNYVIPLAMANKNSHQKILAAADFPCRLEQNFSSLEEVWPTTL